MAVLLIAIVLWTLPALGKGTQRVLFTLFAIGTGLLIYAKAPFEVWLGSILKNGNLLALLILVPLISAPFYYEDYQTELANLAKMRMHSVLGFLLLTAICTHTLSSIVSVGSLLVFYGLLSPYASLYKAEKPFLSTLARAHNASGFWPPAWASIIVYSAVPGMEWARVIPVGIGMVILYLIIHFAGLFIETRRYPDRYPNIHAEPDTVLNKKRLITMLVLAICMILTIVVLNLAAGWELMVAVCITAILFPAVVALRQRKLPEYRTGLKTYYDKQLPKVQGQVALFMISGFLATPSPSPGWGSCWQAICPPGLPPIRP